MGITEIHPSTNEGRFTFTKVRRYDGLIEWNAFDRQTGVYIEHAATKAEARQRIKAEAKAYEELAR